MSKSRSIQMHGCVCLFYCVATFIEISWKKNYEYSNENNFPGKQYVLFMFRLRGIKPKPKQDAWSHENKTEEAQRCRQKCTEMVSELADNYQNKPATFQSWMQQRLKFFWPEHLVPTLFKSNWAWLVLRTISKSRLK